MDNNNKENDNGNSRLNITSSVPTEVESSRESNDIAREIIDRQCDVTAESTGENDDTRMEEELPSSSLNDNILRPSLGNEENCDPNRVSSTQEGRGSLQDNRLDEDVEVMVENTLRRSRPISPDSARERRFNRLANLLANDPEMVRELEPSWLDDYDVSNSSGDENSADGNDKASPIRVLSIPKPKHNWFVVKEILKRETGNFRTPTSFTRRFYGSLHAVQRLELMCKLSEHTGCVNAINFNSSGTMLISGSDDRLVAIWDWAEGKNLSVFHSGHSSNVFQCKFLPVGDDHIVTCSRDGQVKLALLRPSGCYEPSKTIAKHFRPCHKIAVIPRDPYVVISAGGDAQVFFTDIRDKNSTRLVLVKEKSRRVSLYSVNVNPATGNEFCVCGEDQYIRIYDRRYISQHGQTCLKFYPQHYPKRSASIFSVYITCAVFNYNGTEVIGSYNDDDIYLFDTKHASESPYVHKYEGHRNAETVKGVNFFGPKSEYVMSGSDCGHIYFWDKNTEAIVQWMRADEEGVVNCLEPHPKIPVLATSGLDSDVKIWVPSCEQEPTMDGLSKVLHMNRKRRGHVSQRNALNDTLVVWYRQMRLLTNRNGVRPSEFLIGSLNRMIRRNDEALSVASSSASSSSTLSSSSSSESSEMDD